ncbi:MAG TPA: adenylate/guanylate cyclase domain-containing protein [Leptospiraceae bacterium]|nr:adenylate/guanylate cyclase domain-containing protein [Leptospiraceae bacterium]HMY65745.1 adenylate/guanylate cyclase domain-containing protein [Leptospiraceae bacterium]HNF12924.1 adenylate/guanylate cyclase domain-containing protein [Leptospiraceae bacterium]HNF24966.1 adenylate/guanylate cyclase domain-containing protein [Leptospiraceae bacterium]HNI96439.1 adenylate/guanylate cyclase domain-containing protein [Leptospiraceae bacterium]
MRNFASDIWKTLWTGIRAKLSWLTGSLIAFTVLIFSYFISVQEREILTESYRKQTESARSSIQSAVSEIDTVSENLIQIEIFRNHISAKKKELQKYQTVQYYTKEKEYNFLGMKIKAGGMLGNIVGKETFSVKADTYFSQYYNSEDAAQLEGRIRVQLSYSIGRPVTDDEWKRLKAFAAECSQAENEIQKPADSRKEDSNQLKGKKAEAENKYTQSKAALNKEITKIYIQQQKRKLEEMGLNTELIRIQIFEKTRNNDISLSFDSASIDPFSGFSKLNYKEFPAFETSVARSFQRFGASAYSDAKDADTVSWKEKEGTKRTIHTVYSPHFRNQNSTAHAQEFMSFQKLSGFGSYIEDDRQHVKRLTGHIEKLRKRLGELKKTVKVRRSAESQNGNPERKEGSSHSQKSGLKDHNSKFIEEEIAAVAVVPEKDSEFMRLYNEYKYELLSRYKSYNSLKTGLSEKISKKDPGAGYVLRQLESMDSMRDSALEDRIVLRHKTNDSELSLFYTDSRKNAEMRARWKMIRDWIMEGHSEMPSPELKKLFPDGTIIKSRSEAEEIMWEMDSLPFFAEDGIPALSQRILQSNFSGVVQTLIDGTEGEELIQKNIFQLLYRALIICTFSVLLAFYISGIAVQKIKRIIGSAEEVGKGNLNVEFEHAGNDEFGHLTVSLNQMVTGLREREKMRTVLGSMIDPVVVGEAMKDLAALKRGSEKNITAFFSDIAGFTGISEKLKPFELAALLNEYLSAMTIILKKHDGVLDKYIGDAIVGIFNAPLDVNDHCLKAVTASLEMQKKLTEMKQAWKKENKYIPEVHEMHFRIGLNTGSAKVGFMGTDALAAYTMMGDTVNLAARLEAAGKDYGVWNLIPSNVYDLVKDKVFARRLDYVRVKGKNEPVVLYEVISMKNETEEKMKKFVSQYEDGLQYYLNRNWKEAIEKFESAEKTKGEKDKACGILTERCQEYLNSPPPVDWDGVFTRTHK